MNTRRIKFGPWVVLVTLFAVIWSAPVMAQQEDGSSDEEGEQETAALPEVDDNDPMYWAQMREVYAMQQRPFLKEGRFATTLYAGLIPNNIFEHYFPVGLRINYYMLENIGLELSGSYAFSRTTDVNEIVTDESGIGASGQVLIGDTQVSHTTVGIKWSPVYGKFSFSDSGLFYFDMYAFGGAGVVVTQTQTEQGAEPSTTAKPEGVIGAGMAVYAGRHVGIRLDYRQFVFQKVEGVGGVANPSEVSLGLAWFF